MIRAVILTILAVPVVAQQPVTYTPTHLASGSPVLFRAALPKATTVTGTWLKKPVTFTRSANGTWILLAGIDVEQLPGTYTLDLNETLADGSQIHIAAEIPITAAIYRTSKITVPENFISPDADTQARIATEKAQKDAAFAQNIPDRLWSGTFAPPVPISATDSFGTRRTFNGKLASIHRGTDFHAASGTPVYAANDGIVTMAQPMFYEGNFVVVDHGLHFQTLYMHFSRIDVHPGDHVHKGQRLGLSGATGRVTGPHLHFAVRWQGAYLDPVKLLALKLP
jgi:murein DD-endopeptidase MepM/ murein hydrolase activator NlpD